MKFQGVFLGSGAARKIGLGFIPSVVTIQNIHAAALPRIVWRARNAAKATAPEGILIKTVTSTVQAAGGGLLELTCTHLAQTALTIGAGVTPYAGGDIPASAGAAALIPAHMVADYAGDMRARGTAGIVDGFSLTHATNATGKFNRAPNTTYVGVGSRLMIGGQWYSITALSNNGTADDEVTLDRRCTTGAQTVEKILYPHDLVPCPAGITMPPGVVLSETAAVNAANELVLIEAE